MEKQMVGDAALPNLRFETARWSLFTVLMATYILVYFHQFATLRKWQISAQASTQRRDFTVVVDNG